MVLEERSPEFEVICNFAVAPLHFCAENFRACVGGFQIDACSSAVFRRVKRVQGTKERFPVMLVTRLPFDCRTLGICEERLR